MLHGTRLDNGKIKPTQGLASESFKFTERALQALPLAASKHYDCTDAELPYLRVRVGKRDRVLYVVRKLRGAGQPVWHRLGCVGDKPLAEYRVLAESIGTQLAKGEDPRKPKGTRDHEEALTLGRAFDETLAAKTLAPQTIKSYKSDFDLTFGDWRTKPFTEITPDKVAARHRERSVESKARADGALRVLRLVWNYHRAIAAASGLPPAFAVPDPLAMVRIAKSWNGTVARKSYLDGERRPVWLRAVLALPDDDPPALFGTQRDALLVAVVLGLRLRETLHLSYSEVDLEHGFVKVPAGRMKGKREHELPIPKRTLALLQERRAADPDGVYVFPGPAADPKDRKPLDRISTHVFQRIDVQFSPHDLRRTCASWLGNAAPAYVVKDIVSHADPAKDNDVTRRYVQRDLDAMRVWLQRWEDVLYANATPPKRKRRRRAQ